MMTKAKHKKESRLANLQRVVGDVLSDRISILSNKEWEGVAEDAAEQGVSGFLYKHVRDRETELRIQPEILGRLRKDYVSNQAVYLRYLHGALPIFKQLSQQGIPFFIYKGCSLIERYYRDPGLRPISDIDLVMKVKDISSASKIIEEHGFIKDHTFGHHFYCEDFCLDVHEDLFRLDRVPSRKFAIANDGAGLWDCLDTLNIQGCTVSTLAPYDEFTFLCWHAMKHSFSHLKWLVDLGMMYQILSRNSDFRKHLSCLSDDSVRKSVWYVLRLLDEWLGVPIDQELQKNVEPQKIGRIETYGFNLVRRGAIRESFAEVSFLGSIKGFNPKVQFMREMLAGEGFAIRRIVSTGWSTMKSVW